MGRLIISLSFPAMGGMILYSLFSLIDTFFVARLGSAALAALTLCIPIEILLIAVGTATGVGITSLISRTLGKKNVGFADNIAWHGIIICVIYSVFSSLVGLYNIDFLLQTFGCTPEVYGLSKEYLRVLLLGSIFLFIPVIAGSIVQGEGNTVLPTLAALLGISLNVLLDPICIFGCGPIQGMGLEGAALATVGAQMGATLFITILMVKRPLLLSWSLQNFRPQLNVLSGIYKVGLPTMVMEIISVITMIILNNTLVGFNYTAVAVMGIFLRIRSLFYMPISGLSQGVMPIAGFAYGSKNKDRVKEVMIKSSLLSFVLLLLGWYLMQYQPLWIMGFFSHDPTMTFMGLKCMKLATIFLPFMGPIIILYTVLQAVGKGLTAMWLSIIRTLLFFLPAILILPHYFNLNGVWLAFSVSEGLSVLLSLFYFIRLWKDLQERGRYTLMVMLQKGTFFQRMKTWLKW